MSYYRLKYFLPELPVLFIDALMLLRILEIDLWPRPAITKKYRRYSKTAVLMDLPDILALQSVALASFKPLF